ncbi:MAG: hypothetical protein WC788_01695 [Candidatus Paceibacterota bacterium]|jgi:hypothetical protein
MISLEYKAKEKETRTTVKKLMCVFLLLVAAAIGLNYFTGVYKTAVYTFAGAALLAAFVAADAQLDLSVALLREFDREIEQKEKEFQLNEQGK